MNSYRYRKKAVSIFEQLRVQVGHECVWNKIIRRHVLLIDIGRTNLTEELRCHIVVGVGRDLHYRTWRLRGKGEINGMHPSPACHQKVLRGL